VVLHYHTLFTTHCATGGENMNKRSLTIFENYFGFLFKRKRLE
jgi:hypothetical protein